MKAGVKKPSRWMYLSLLITLTATLAGCGAGKTLVVKPAEARLRVTSVDISEANSTVIVPGGIREEFRNKLAQLLYEKQGEEEAVFTRGNDLKVKYRFVQFEKGNQFTRWFLGGIGNAGEGSLTIEAKYFDANGRELATIQAEGKIGSGFFGGSVNFAVGKAAEEIAKYTKENFK